MATIGIIGGLLAIVEFFLVMFSAGKEFRINVGVAAFVLILEWFLCQWIGPIWQSIGAGMSLVLFFNRASVAAVWFAWIVYLDYQRAKASASKQQ